MTAMLRLFVVVAAMVSMVACGKSSFSPTAPTAASPNQSGYELLVEAAPKHYAGETGGESFPAWVRLIAIDPSRGSAVKPEGACPTDCLTMTLEGGSDDGMATSVEMAYSVDGEAPISRWFSSVSFSDANPRRNNFGPWRFYEFTGANAPKWMIFRFSRTVAGGPKVLYPEGRARIFLDYR